MGADHTHGHMEGDCCSTAAATGDSGWWLSLRKTEWLTLLLSGGLLLITWPLDHFIFSGKMPEWMRFGLYLTAYLPVALPVWRDAFRAFRKGDYFNEFVLMGVATLGAFYLGEYAEAVAVMLFYTIGEWVQGAAVARSRRSIRDLIAARPDLATRIENGTEHEVSSAEIIPGDHLLVKVGERVAFDGTLVSEGSQLFDTASLTGESMPREILPGHAVLAGMVPIRQNIRMRVDKPLEQSTLARMLHLVEEAASRKAPTEKLIRKLASYYTPIVFFTAVLICIAPAFFTETYHFNTWLYRSLIFLVISCPCALVISIPLGFFGGLGAASRRGILVKGAHFLDALTKARSFIFDKTGTLTTGQLAVTGHDIRPGFTEDVLKMAAAVEHGVHHPLARPIAAAFPEAHRAYSVSHKQQLQGLGVEALVDQHHLILGNAALLRQKGIEIPEKYAHSEGIQILIGLDGLFAGAIFLRDEIKEEAGEAIAALKKISRGTVSILSGDTQHNVQTVAKALHISSYEYSLLPEEKLRRMQAIRDDIEAPVVFVGEGFNDAAVLAGADVGIAMGKLGAEASIESADIIIQSDKLDRIPKAVAISKATRRVIWQNIAFALGTKVLVLTLGVFGLASMWQAVFADVGVALLAIANAVRLQRMQF